VSLTRKAFLTLEHGQDRSAIPTDAPGGLEWGAMAGTEKTRILVIEDDLGFASTLRLLLEKRLAAEVVVATGAESARDALLTGSFDLITLDVQLSDDDGLLLLENIRPYIPFTPVIVVTGQGDEVTAARALQAGASGYVVKDNRLGSILPSALERALDHQQTEEALKASEIRYRRLFEAAKDGILILDAETGRITDVNPFLKRLLGYSREEMLGRKLWEIGPFKDIDESRDLFGTLQDNKYIRYEHLPLQAKDGRGVDVEFVSNVYSADHHKVIQCNIRDITERKREQEKNTFEFLTLKGIIESTDNPIFSVDTDYRYTSFNRSHARTMKALYGADIALGKSLLECHSVDEDRDLARANLEKAMLGERVLVEGCAGAGPSRSFFEILHNPITDEDGRVVGVAVFAKVTTEQKAAEEALRQSEETLQVIFDAVPGLLFLKDGDNRLLRVNRAFCEALGLKEKEIIGKPGSEIFPEQSEQYWKDDLQVIESGSSKLGIREPVQTPRGIRWFRTDKLPYRNADGEIIGVIGFAVDVSESVEYEKDLERVNVELDGYAHTVSHDLRGPLASIGVLLHLFRELLEEPRSEEVDSEMLEIVTQMSRNLEKSDGLIGALLKLAEAGQAPEQALDISIGLVVARVLDERDGQIRERGATVELDGELGHVVADYSHVYQIFANLIGNAIEHNDGDSLVIEVRCLRCEAAGAHRYLVRDNGAGIAEAHIDKIFVPFFKGEPGGSGIGLSTVKKIVGVYGGEIRAYNDNGACFEFTLHDVSG
jgi:PAS domain S-box-containing protein